jgi:hypothetical protein
MPTSWDRKGLYASVVKYPMRMVQKIRTAFVLAALGLLSASCASGGGIASGQKFGVQIGMQLDDASAILRQRGLQQESPIFVSSGFTAGRCCG